MRRMSLSVGDVIDWNEYDILEQQIHRASQGLTSETGKSYITVTER